MGGVLGGVRCAPGRGCVQPACVRRIGARGRPSIRRRAPGEACGFRREVRGPLGLSRDALPAGARAPSPEQTQIIKDAIKAFDEKKLAKAEALFSQGIKTW